MCIYVDIQQEDNKDDCNETSDINVARDFVDDSIEGKVEDKDYENSNDIQGIHIWN